MRFLPVKWLIKHLAPEDWPLSFIQVLFSIHERAMGHVYINPFPSVVLGWGINTAAVLFVYLSIVSLTSVSRAANAPNRFRTIYSFPRFVVSFKA